MFLPTTDSSIENQSILELEFQKDKNPDPIARTRITGIVGLSDQTVQVIFFYKIYHTPP